MALNEIRVAHYLDSIGYPILAWEPIDAPPRNVEFSVSLEVVVVRIDRDQVRGRPGGPRLPAARARIWKAPSASPSSEKPSTGQPTSSTGNK